MKKYIFIIVFAIIIFLLGIYFIITSNNIRTNDESKTVDFELVFTEDSSLGKQKIVSKNIFNKETYDLFVYNGNVEVIINNEKYDLKEALTNKRLKVDDILNKIKKDADNNIIEYGMFKDGGTILYKYDTYKVIKYNTLNGNNDMYIGSKDLEYSIGEK